MSAALERFDFLVRPFSEPANLDCDRCVIRCAAIPILRNS